MNTCEITQIGTIIETYKKKPSKCVCNLKCNKNGGFIVPLTMLR